jgi:hypothetical protein
MEYIKLFRKIGSYTFYLYCKKRALLRVYALAVTFEQTINLPKVFRSTRYAHTR